MTDYSSYSDEALCEIAKTDSLAEEFLLVKYKELVRREAHNLYISWGELDDLLQEGMIGLLQAVREYSADNGAGFVTFASICVRGKMLNAVTAANRKKHKAMEDFVSLDSPDFRDENGNGLYAAGRYDNPERLVIERVDANLRIKQIEEILSKFEKEVFRCYLKGMEYREIAEKMGKTPKAIDNAFQRIRKKTKEALL